MPIPGPHIRNLLPSPLSGRSNPATTPVVRTDVNFDVALGGIPFLSGISNRSTYFRRRLTRDLAPIRKDQFDNGQVVGEQSLTGWWLRSQTSWHGGAGIKYSDTGLDNSLGIRFDTSYGVDPWTINQLTLLNSTNNALPSANTNLLLRGVNVAGTNYAVVADGTALKRVTANGTVVTYTVTGMTHNIVALTDDGTNYYVATDEGIFKGPLDNSVAGALIYALAVPMTFIVLNFVKSRLMAGINNSIYELVPAGPALPAAVYTHPNPSYSFQSIADGPVSIYFAGGVAHRSEIIKLSLDTAGTVVTLTLAVTAAQMPIGETINDIYTYLQTFMGIATNKGFRVATLDSAGTITYGPLLFTNADGVHGIAGRDRFLYTGNTNSINGASGTMRVDVSVSTANNGFAYANDYSSHLTGTTRAVANFGESDQMCFTVAGRGLFIQDASNLEAAGSVLFSRVRYNTLENKLFKFLKLTCPAGIQGNIQIYSDDPTGTETFLVQVNNDTSSLDNITIGAPAGPSEWIALRMVLTQGSATTGPILNGWQVKALPGSTRQKLITVPLLLFDHEKDKFGQRKGYRARAWTVMQQFEALAVKGDVVLYQDMNTGEAQVCVIDDYEFEQMAVPQAKGDGFSGYLTVQLRSIP